MPNETTPHGAKDCAFCGKGFPTFGGLAKHLLAAHTDLMSGIFPYRNGVIVKCWCGLPFWVEFRGRSCVNPWANHLKANGGMAACLTKDILGKP